MKSLIEGWEVQKLWKIQKFQEVLKVWKVWKVWEVQKVWGVKEVQEVCKKATLIELKVSSLYRVDVDQFLAAVNKKLVDVYAV